MAQTIIISAADTLCFKDGKPFNRGDETFADSVFPPLPSVIYGFLNNLYLNEKEADLKKSRKDLLGNPQGALKITDFRLICKNSLTADNLYPLPFDIAVQINKEAGQKFKIEKVGYSKLISNILTDKNATNHFLQSTLEGKTEDNTKYYLTVTGFKNYINGLPANLLISDIVPIKKYLTAEFKVGMGRNDDTRTSEAGQLYTVKIIRPKAKLNHQLDLLVSFENIDFTLPSTGRFGAEGKLATVEPYYGSQPIEPPKDILDNEIIKMVLITPAVFEHGWKPDDENISNKIIAAATGKPISIGGWDMAGGKPKAMLKGIQAGAVYFLQGSKSELEEIILEYHGKSICKIVNEIHYDKEGFGIVYFIKSELSQKI